MSYRGDIAEDQAFSFKFTTRDAAGAPTTLSGTPSLEVFKDGGLTETTTGPTLTADFDSVTGLNHVAMVTTDAFYVTGSDYEVVIAAGTVDGTSVVGEVVASFSIENRYKGVQVEGIDANAITATAINADAITAAKIADDAIATEHLATGAITADTIAANAITPGAVSAEIDVNVTQWLGSAAATPSVAGVPEVDLTHVKGSAQTATDLQDFADAGYDPVTNKIEGCKLNDDMAGTDNAPLAASAPTNWSDMAVTATTGMVTVGSVDTDAIDATAMAANAINSTVIADNAITAAKINADAITDAKVASDVTIASVTGSVGSVSGDTKQTADVATLITTVGTAGDGLTSIPKTGYALSAAGVDAILDEAVAELTSTPGASPSAREALAFLYMHLRNKIDSTATKIEIHNDAGTPVSEATTSDDGTTFSKTKFADPA